MLALAWLRANVGRLQVCDALLPQAPWVAMVRGHPAGGPEVLVRKPLGHHRRDAVAHGDTVEGVRDLHRALLVGDDERPLYYVSRLTIQPTNI